MTVNAALNYCHESGYTEVGWHCEEHNMGSIATAEKVGFEKKTEYYAWVCMKDPKEHIKERKRAEKQYPWYHKGLYAIDEKMSKRDFL
jgi:RimJ/RimL family protein N-acetyltransferase